MIFCILCLTKHHACVFTIYAVTAARQRSKQYLHAPASEPWAVRVYNRSAKAKTYITNGLINASLIVRVPLHKCNWRRRLWLLSHSCSICTSILWPMCVLSYANAKQPIQCVRMTWDRARRREKANNNNKKTHIQESRSSVWRRRRAKPFLKLATVGIACMRSCNCLQTIKWKTLESKICTNSNTQLKHTQSKRKRVKLKKKNKNSSVNCISIRLDSNVCAQHNPDARPLSSVPFHCHRRRSRTCKQ